MHYLWAGNLLKKKLYSTTDTGKKHGFQISLRHANQPKTHGLTQ